MIFFDELLPLRLNASMVAGSGPLKALDESSGFLGDITQRRFRPSSNSSASTILTAWLPDAAGRSARGKLFLRRESFEH